MEKPKKISFQTAKYDELVTVVNLNFGKKSGIFDEWFNYNYSLNPDETQFFIELIDEYKDILSSFSEEDLKMEYISPIIRKVRFRTQNCRGFFNRPLKTKINDVQIGGITDFMVASGIKIPQEPYFFIQEFKQTKHSVDAEDQLLAEMLVATELNKTNIMRGACIIGTVWRFVVLEKNDKNEYLYYISEAFDSLSFNGLKQIYVCLQAVKHLYCK